MRVTRYQANLRMW